MKNNPARFGIYLALMLLCQTVIAQTTWTNATGNNLWNDSGNWSEGTVPSSTSDVVFDGSTSIDNSIINSDVLVKSITLAADYTGDLSHSTHEITTSVNFEINNGTFSGGTGLITITKHFIVNGGVFTSTSGTLVLKSIMTKASGGSFIHNNGTVSIEGTDSGGAWGFDSDVLFYKFNFSKGHVRYIRILTGKIVVLDELILNNGFLHFGVIEARGKITHASTFDGGLNSHIIINSTINDNIIWSSGGAMPGLEFSPTTNATLTCPSIVNSNHIIEGALTMYSGTINHGNVKVTVQRDLIIDGGTLNLGSGEFNVQAGANVYLKSGQIIGSTGLFKIPRSSGKFFEITGGSYTTNASSFYSENSLNVLNGSVNAIDAIQFRTGAVKLLGTSVINAPSLEMIIAGSFTKTLGTFNTNNGQLTIGASASWSIDVELSVEHLKLDLTSSGILRLTNKKIITNSLSLVNGKFDQGIIEVNGIINYAPTFRGSSASGTGKLLIKSQIGQVLDWPWGAFPPFEIISTSDIHILGPSIADSRNFIYGDVSLYGGKFTLRSGNLTLSKCKFTLDGGEFIGGSGDLKIDDLGVDNAIIKNGSFTLGSGDTYINGLGSITVESNGVFTLGNGNLTSVKNFLINGGIVNSNGLGDITALGNLELISGDFKAPSQNLYIKKYLYLNGSGTFSHNNGTIIFNGGSQFFRMNSGITLHNLTLNNSSSINIKNSTGTANSQFDVEGTLILQNGRINTGTIVAKNNITHLSTYDGSGVGGHLEIESSGLSINMNGGSFPSFTMRPSNTSTVFGSGTGVNTTITGNTKIKGGAFNLLDGKVRIVGHLQFYEGTINLATSTTGELETSKSFYQTGGDLYGNSGKLTIGDSYVQSGGTYFGMNEEKYVVDTFRVTGTGIYNAAQLTKIYKRFVHDTPSVFNHNNGTFEFVGPTGYINSTNANEVQFYDLHLNLTGTTNRLYAYTNIDIDGSFTIDKGRMDLALNDKNLNIAQDLILNHTQNALYTTNEVITFDGTVLQNIQLSGVDQNMHTLVVDNAGPGVRMSGKIRILDHMTMTDGDFDLNGGDITLHNSSYITGETGSNRIKGNSGEIILSSINLNSQNTEYNDIRGLGINITTRDVAMGITEIRRGHAIQSSNGSSSVSRYFNISPTVNTNLHVKLQMEYYEEELNGQGEAQLYLWRSTDDGVTWAYQYSTRSEDNNYVEKDSVTAFSKWTISNGDSGPLPIELVSFDGKQQQSGNTLQWATLTETNNDLFVIEKSRNALHFSQLQTIKGAGNSTQRIQYEIQDPTPYATTFYRLKQIDYDGQYSYSPIIAVYREEVGSKLFVNNVNHLLHIPEDILKEGFLEIFDLSGRKIEHQNVLTNSVSLEHLTKGVYLFRYTDENKVMHRMKSWVE